MVWGVRRRPVARGRWAAPAGREPLVEVVLPAAQQRHERRDEGQRGRGREHDDQAVMEGLGDQMREELHPGEDAHAVRRQRVQNPGRPEQVTDRVDAEERGEQGADGRQVRDTRGHTERNALGVQPGGERGGQRGGEADDHE